MVIYVVTSGADSEYYNHRIYKIEPDSGDTVWRRQDFAGVRSIEVRMSPTIDFLDAFGLA